MTNRYFIYLAYNGTRYCGWQRQPNGVSVQERLEEALATVLRQPVPVTAAGRTDAGVHARCMAAHFDREEPVADLPLLTEKLNRILPEDIAVDRMAPVRPDAHARFDALSRTYQYVISDLKSPFDHEWICRMSLKGMDFGRMNDACRALLEARDFTSFSKLHTDTATNLCRVSHAAWERAGACRVFTIRADRFLRNMVRAIVGTLFDVGRGKRTEADFRRLIEAENRSLAGSSAPAKGLALTAVDYPDSLFLPLHP
ncbi:MAG: tRNA pseudouridine(38-40) synthase TruA [Tannerella sp.]|jgi:tRNA pseudouridine38-40 synthase|nr:tRNA pseudouridine(38-40) synthase TruA [Tannerella sp.]